MGTVFREVKGYGLLKLRSDNYKTWKIKMRSFLQGFDYQTWLIVSRGPLEITKEDPDGNLVPKPEEEYTKEDYAILEHNARATAIMQQAIGEDEFDQII